MLHDDEQRINYTDEEILNALNSGLRVIRRTITDIQPELLMDTVKGILEPEQDEIILSNRPLMIIEVTAGEKYLEIVKGYSNKKIFHNDEKIFNNKTPIYSWHEDKIFAEHKLEETTLHHIREKFLVGCPKSFYRVGLKVLKVYPKPRVETAYTVRIVEDIEELEFEDKTPLLNEFDDFLVEYATYRLALTDEFDMTQEQQIISNIHQQIASILSLPPAGAVICGYW